MVAYSFKRQFVEPIRWGLGLGLDVPDGVVAPKRQTIRADRKRHARPGEEMQLYCGMRTRGCFLIGRARCATLRSIRLRLQRYEITVGTSERYHTMKQLHAFAQSDGFKSYEEMADFWAREHGNTIDWRGVIITWEPIV